MGWYDDAGDGVLEVEEEAPEAGGGKSKKVSVRHYRDKSGELERIGKIVVGKKFPILQNVTILYTWRTPPRIIGDRVKLGAARKLTTRERDVFGFDFEIEVSKDTWPTLSKAQRFWLVWHELKHCSIIIDENLQPMRDDCGRIRLAMNPHDVVIEAFADEIKLRGVPGHLRSDVRFLWEYYKKNMVKKALVGG